VVKFTVGSSNRLKKTSGRALWRSQPPLKWKERLVAAEVLALYKHQTLPELLSPQSGTRCHYAYKLLQTSSLKVGVM
jgi:hypothetical protein